MQEGKRKTAKERFEEMREELSDGRLQADKIKLDIEAEAYKIYEKHGYTGVFRFAEKLGFCKYLYCEPCEDTTPTISDSCLVCGSVYTK